jgi:hypothetical protein
MNKRNSKIFSKKTFGKKTPRITENKLKKKGKIVLIMKQRPSSAKIIKNSGKFSLF